jgi:hypothetical protein
VSSQDLNKPPLCIGGLLRCIYTPLYALVSSQDLDPHYALVSFKDLNKPPIMHCWPPKIRTVQAGHNWVWNSIHNLVIEHKIELLLMYKLTLFLTSKMRGTLLGCCSWNSTLLVQQVGPTLHANLLTIAPLLLLCWSNIPTIPSYSLLDFTNTLDTHTDARKPSRPLNSHFLNIFF